ncbi:MAG: MBOAT family protein, partial [Leptospiraceae bacterium]|nr:MBOAT family protein [Leptospiraceae bacterium]
MWSVPEYGILIFASTCIDYIAGRIIGDTRSDSRTEDLESNQRIRKLALIVSLLMNLGILGYYKYHDFFLTSFIEFINTLHPDAIGPGTRYELLARLILPVGISFFTFQSMSYTIDAYRGVLPPEKDFIKFALFVSFFPQLVAGPIVTAKEFLPQLQEEKPMDSDLMRQAARWFALGYFKKVVLADNMAPIVDTIYSNPYAYDTAGHWLGAFGFWIQVYCDFSGYSDMAWGAAMFLGFRLPENFRLPYLSRSVTEHWQRWHISLIRWNRDYLYFPLGGNRVSFWRHKFNVWFTMFVAGVWHGANWTFIIWGAIHGSIMAAESTWRDVKAHINERWRRKQGTDLDVEGSTRRLDGSRKSEAVRFFGANWPLDIVRLCATSFVTIFFG